MPVTNQNTLRGIAYMLSAIAIFAVQDGLSRALAETQSPIFITMWRYWAFGAVCLVLLWRTGFANGLRSGQPVIQIARGVGLAVEIGLAILAFRLIGLAGTHAVFAFGPLLIVALSQPLLGERVGWRRWAAIGVGFLGMILIIRPGAQPLGLGMAVALVAMVMYSFYGIATRRVARTDTAMTSFYYTGIGGAAIVTLVGPWFWSPMSPAEMVMMATLCVTGMTGHFILIKAFEAAEASALQPFAYLQTVLSSLVGLTVFGEIVPVTTFVGGAIVIGAGLFAFWRERVRAKQAAVAKPPLADVA